jgi:hypothetical protein
MTNVANALVEHIDAKAPDAAPLPASDTAAVLQIIDRAARDPLVDIDKMKQLMEMRNQMRAEQAELEFDTAMAAAQEEMEPVRADANNPSTKSKYASLAALDAAIRPIYTKHGFAVTFDTADCPKEGYERIVAKVSHPCGHRERPHIDMPSDGKGAKGGDVMTKTHATGSAVQYGRRYLLGMIFNIVVDKDDDGNAASAKPQAFITEEQVMQLRDLLTATGANEAKFLQFIKVDALDHIYASAFDRAVQTIKSYRGAK